MKLTRIGVDVAKQVFQVHGVDRHEQPIWRRRLSRDRWLKAVQEVAEPGCEIGMEACGGAHHWARQLRAMGFRVRLIAPQFVKPYVKSNKNDAKDAEAICEAMSRPSMRFVSVKSVAQQDLQAMHRVRASLVEQRTAKGNQIRGLVAEYGLVAAKEMSSLRRAIPSWLEDADNGLSASFRYLLEGLWRDLRTAEERIVELDGAPVAAVARRRPRGRHGLGGLCWRCKTVCQRSTDGRIAWPYTTAVQLRRQGPLARH
jgi:transposase